MRPKFKAQTLYSRALLARLLCLLTLLGLSGGARAQFTSGALSGTDNTAVTGSSVGTPVGATWSLYANSNQTYTYTADGMAGSTQGVGNWAIEGPSSTGYPTQNQYDVRADFKFLTVPAASGQLGVLTASDGTVSGGYYGQLILSGGSWVPTLTKGYNGTLAASAGFSPAAGSSYRLKVTRRNNATVSTNQDLALYVQRLSDSLYLSGAGTFGASAVPAVTYTDSSSPITANGRPAFWVYNADGAALETQGIHVANFQASYPTSAATAYTLSGTLSGTNGAANTLTLTSNGSLASGVTITVSVTAGAATLNGASSTSQTVTLAAGANTTGTVTVQSAVTGSSTLHFANSSTLTDPGDATYASSSGPTTLGVGSGAWHFSPGNWSGDTGRGGSAYRQAWTSGAYATVYWNASSSPTATLQVSNQTAGSHISYSLNGALTDGVSVPSSGGVSVGGVAPNAANVLTVYCRDSPQSSRWALTNAFKVAGLVVDGGSSAGAAPAWNGRWVLVVGDSITEGILTGGSGGDNLTAYSFLAGQGLLGQGYDYGVSACGYSGWIQTGDAYGSGDVPRYYYVSGGAYQGNSVSRWDLLDASDSLLDGNSHLSAYGATGQEPAAITLNYGTNEALTALSASDMTASVTGCLAALRGAAPGAKIFVIVPFGLYSTARYASGPTYVTALKAGVSNYQSAHPSDANVSLIDLGAAASSALDSSVYGADVHPNAAGHAWLAPQVLAPVVKGLSSLPGGVKRRLQ